MPHFWTPRLIARAAPGAKLLIMFRDPIERFRSGVPHRQSQRPDHRLEAVTADAIERGEYATQLRRVLASHDASKLLILQYEKCVADPAGQYRRTLALPGVDPDHVHEGFTQQRGTTQAARKKPLWDDLMDGLRAVMEPEVARLAELTPEIDVALWPNFAHLRPPMRSPLDRLRAGGEPGPPDFIGVGALGSGTGWWHAMLLQHPEIRPPAARRRALHHFDRFCAAELTRADIAEYHARFGAGRGRSPGSGPAATCSTRGRRRSCGAPRPTPSCSSCSRTRSSATARASPTGSPGGRRARRST